MSDQILMITVRLKSWEGLYFSPGLTLTEALNLRAALEGRILEPPSRRLTERAPPVRTGSPMDHALAQLRGAR